MSFGRDVDDYAHGDGGAGAGFDVDEDMENAAAAAEVDDEADADADDVVDIDSDADFEEEPDEPEFRAQDNSSTSDAYEFLLMFLLAWSARHRISETAMDQLLKALQAFFSLLRCVFFRHPQTNNVQAALRPPSSWPRSLASAGNAVDYDKYILCPDGKCGAVYLATAFQRDARDTCHSQLDVETPLGKSLFRGGARDRRHADGGGHVYKKPAVPLAESASVSASSDRKWPSPKLMLPYAGIVRGLKALLSRPGFEQKCEHWRDRYNSDNKRAAWSSVRYDAFGWPEPDMVEGVGDASPVMSDVYDGQMWEDYMFLGSDGKPHLDAETRARQILQREHARWRAAGSSPPPTAEPAAASAASAAAAPSHRDIGRPSKKARHHGPDRAAAASSGGAAAASGFGTAAGAAAAAPSRSPLLAEPGVLALQLNIDWFLRDKKARNYSMGGMYMCVLNLPREVRYLPENLILLGVLPGPGVTSRQQLQGVLRLAVQELLSLLTGVLMVTHGAPTGRKVRAFLFNVVCDTDARGPVGGFMGHASQSGCAFCEQDFGCRQGSNARNYSWSGTMAANADRRCLSPLRTDESHRHHAQKWADLDGPRREEAAKEHGSRYCALMDLPYFDTVRGMPLDAMHNIYLGTCKAVMFALVDPQPTRSPPPAEAEGEAEAGAAGAAAAAAAALDLPVLSKDDLATLQEYMDACEVPRDVGQIPNKVARNLSSFKAAEWANWISIFALPHLAELRSRYILEGKTKERVTEKHLELFACLRTVAIEMRAYNVTAVRVRTLEQLLLQVSMLMEQLFGPDFIKPNQHYSLHLGPMLMDLGPTAGWSCNPYERFNGLLGNVPMNTAFAETCIMRRALHLISVSQHASCSLAGASSAGAVPDGCAQADHFRMIRRMLSGDDEEVLVGDAAVTVSQRKTAAGALQVRTAWKSQDAFVKYRTATGVTGAESFPGCMRGAPDILLLSHASVASFRPVGELLNCLVSHYGRAYFQQLAQYRQATEPISGFLKLNKKQQFDAIMPKNLSTIIHVHDTLDLGGQVCGSLRGKNSKAARVYMDWCDDRTKEWKPYFARVNFYFAHDFAVPTESQHGWTFKMTRHYFAAVQYYKDSPSGQRKGALKPPATYEFPYLQKAPYAPEDVYNIMCVQSIAGRWIACVRPLNKKPRASNPDRDFCIQALPIPFSSRQHL